MSYEYMRKDHYGHEFSVADHYDTVCVSVKSSTSSKRGFGATYIPKEDAPRVALEILKAAGFDQDHEKAGFSLAFSYLRDAVGLMEAAKSVTARELRRAEVCKELGAFYTPGAPDQPLLRAIDRIIELESK